MPSKPNPDFKQLLSKVDFSDEKSLLSYAEHLEGMSFQDVLDLEILSPKAQKRHDRAMAKEEAYARAAFKGGVGNLVEERYFAYDANSDDRPDFNEAGVELKTTCFDMVSPKGGVRGSKAHASTGGGREVKVPSAGERLSMTMIPLDRDISLEFDSSHFWQKCRRVLLVFYQRDRTADKYDQVIRYVYLFTPPEKDLQIIREDYETIARLVQEGRADELSEGLTTYLGAATKGTSEAKMWVTQHYPRHLENGATEYRKAKRRVFSLKRKYMDYVLNNYVIPAREAARRRADALVGQGAWKTASEYGSGEVNSAIASPLAQGETFEGRLRALVARYVGRSDRELCELFGLSYASESKSGWATLNRRILGVKGKAVEEFEKAGITARAVRVEEKGNIKEHISLPPFEFLDLMNEKDWESSVLHEQLESQSFFFTVFHKRDGVYYLRGALLWSMPESDVDGPARECWERARKVIDEGVKIETVPWGAGLKRTNNLPKTTENPVLHVRPHSTRAAYLLEDGTRVGDVERDASRLPDGRWMTRQSFWINKGCIEPLVRKLL